MVRLAAIGFGGRLCGMVRGMCKEFGDDVKLVAIADPNRAEAAKRLDAMKLPAEDVTWYDSDDALLQHADAFDGILIGTRCHLHTPIACKVAKTGKPLFLEKPVAVSREQLAQLRAAFKGREEQVVVSFPLRVTSVFLAALEVVRSGRLGAINQVQAWNNVNYGGVYFGEWYRNWDEVGGLWLQKATHDFDYLNRLMGVRPTAVTAMSTQVVYGGDMPHDLRCSNCDQTATCPEAPAKLQRRNDGGGMGKDDHWCAFSKEIRNQDAGSAIIRYENGALVSYNQNFISRRSAGKRGALIIGYLGSVEFDWYTEKVRVVEHHTGRVDEMHCPATGGHGGGDTMLQQSFIDVIRGTGPSVATLHDGLLSVEMCLSARESCADGGLKPVPSTAVQHLPANTMKLRPVEV